MNIKSCLQQSLVLSLALVLTALSCHETSSASADAVSSGNGADSTRPVIPSTAYEGFGAVTRGGTGKPVYHVTQLGATGPGSLHDAMGSNRTIVFDVAGTIRDFRWDGSGRNAVSGLTIDGSTAPSPGITLDNNNNGYCLTFENGCHDIIVSNIRIRNAGMDGISVVSAYNMIFDHISISGSGDGSLDISQGAHNITVQWCIFGPGKEGWAGSMLIAYPPTKDISIHHNLFSSYGAGAGERNPFVHNAINYKPNEISYLMCDFSNNIVWNWGKSDGGFGYGSGADFGGTLQLRSNYYQSNSYQREAIVQNRESKWAKVYASGNISGNTGVDPNRAGNVTRPWNVAPVTIYDACTAARLVYAFAGVRPLDEVDQRIVDEISMPHCPQIKISLPETTHVQTKTGDAGTLISTSFDDAGDVPTDLGIYNSFSGAVFKSSPGSFRSEVRANEDNMRSEISYNGFDPEEGVYEYDVFFENWKPLPDGGHTVEWQPANGGSAVLSLQNYGGQFQVVRSVNGNNNYGPESLKTVEPNHWYHLRWEIKWSPGPTGYIRLFLDGHLYYSYQGITTDKGGVPSFRLGQVRWPNAGNALHQPSVVYYDNLSVSRK